MNTLLLQATSKLLRYVAHRIYPARIGPTLLETANEIDNELQHWT